MKKNFAILTLSLFLMITPLTEARAEGAADIGYAIGSGFGTLIYTPLKLASAVFMGFTGGISLMGTVLAGAEQQSIDFVKLGMSGDWWVAPKHLRGDEQFHFMEAP